MRIVAIRTSIAGWIVMLPAKFCRSSCGAAASGVRQIAAALCRAEERKHGFRTPDSRRLRRLEITSSGSVISMPLLHQIVNRPRQILEVLITLRMVRQADEDVVPSRTRDVGSVVIPVLPR